MGKKQQSEKEATVPGKGQDVVGGGHEGRVLDEKDENGHPHPGSSEITPRSW